MKQFDNLDLFATDVSTAVSCLESYANQGRTKARPVIDQKPLPEILSSLNLAQFVEGGELNGDALSSFLNSYLQTSTNFYHPGFLAHQCALPTPTGAIGALVDGFTNNSMAIYEMGPSAAVVEYFMINWLLKKVGWEETPFPIERSPKKIHGGGVLVDGGSVANLTALVAARSYAVPDFWEKGNSDDLIVLTSEQGHYSIRRALGIMGLGDQHHYALPVDSNGRIIVSRLSEIIANLQAQGKKIMALVANACGTAVGLYDDLEGIAKICNQANVWLHVDGAHGASALISEKYKRLLKGIEKADSMIWDAHKMMRTPIICAAVLFKNAKYINSAFYQDASYLEHDKDQPGYDTLHRTIECTKPALGLRFFMAVASMGESRLGECISHQYDVCKEVGDYLSRLDNYEIAVKPDSNILCFRVNGSDDLQNRIRDQLIKNGNFHLSSTLFRGHRWLRLVFMNPETSLFDIKEMVKEINLLIV